MPNAAARVIPMTRTPTFTANAVTVLEKRYLKKDAEGQPTETPREMLTRVAQAVADADRHHDPEAEVDRTAAEFYDLMARLDFLPNSPTLMNAGRELGQLSACFVLPVEDSMDSIFEAVKNTALIHKSGGGTGFSFSRIRPRNDIVRSTSGVSSGPISFMQVFDTATEMIKQGGTRRGANMGILRIDHPDILSFISVKSDTSQLTNFNLSVGLTEAFMEAAERDEEYDLVSPRSGETAGRLRAREVFDRIVEEAWATGEPGIVFVDRLDRDNPTPALGPIEATNPCGEQPLLPYESCNLGSVNLAHMVSEGEVDWERLRQTVERAVHFLDNVIDVNRYPLPEIEHMTRGNRKIGLGVMGWASMLFHLGIPYGSADSLDLADRVMSFIDEAARNASAALVETRGTFPNFSGSRCDHPDREPVRNATRTTIAPTGTISILADCSSGIEPLFSLAFVRRVLDGTELLEINPIFEETAQERGFYSAELMQRVARGASIQQMKEIPEDVRRVFLTAHDITPEDHIRMQAAFQRHTDNAVSKTVNFPSSATPAEVAQAYQMAYRLNCKGLTIYRDGAREGQVLSTPAPKAPQRTLSSAHKRDRPRVLSGKTYQMQTGCGPLYITMNEDERGLFEVFTTMGKAGGCAASQCEGIGRLVSLAWRSGVGPESVIRQLRGISCHKPAGFGPNRVLSCADALSIAIQNHIDPHSEVEKHVSPGGACPECGDAVEHEEGCVLCRSCGFSECG